MKSKCSLKIVTNDNNMVEEEIVSLVTENNIGRIEILPNHAEMVMSTVPSVTTFIDTRGNKKVLFTSFGILYIKNNSIRFCCDSINYPEEIDLERAEAAEERAKARLNKRGNIDIERAEKAILRARARIKVKKNN